jgi:hypothetical protein
MLSNDVCGDFNKSYNMGHFVVDIIIRYRYLLKKTEDEKQR